MPHILFSTHPPLRATFSAKLRHATTFLLRPVILPRDLFLQEREDPHLPRGRRAGGQSSGETRHWRARSCNPFRDVARLAGLERRRGRQVPHRRLHGAGARAFDGFQTRRRWRRARCERQPLARTSGDAVTACRPTPQPADASDRQHSRDAALQSQPRRRACRRRKHLRRRAAARVGDMVFQTHRSVSQAA